MLGALHISERQEFLGGSFAESLEAWHAGPRDQVLGMSIWHSAQPVGMTLFKRPPASPDWVSPNAASIHGLKIASPWQGQGWGHAAFELAMDQLKKDWPAILRLMLAVDAENTLALSIYRSYGMKEIGPVVEGCHGPEHRFAVSLSP